MRSANADEGDVAAGTICTCSSFFSSPPAPAPRVGSAPDVLDGADMHRRLQRIEKALERLVSVESSSRMR